MSINSRTWRLAFIGLAGPLVAGQALAADSTVLRVGGYVAADGTIAPAAAVVIENGVLRAIRGAEEQVAGAKAVEYPGAILCPGLIDVHSLLTAAGNDRETAKALEPGLVASDFFDRHHRDLRRALSGGITTVLLAPAGNNVVCGTTAAVKTGGWSEGEQAVVAPGPLKLSLAPEVWGYEREPTSRVGAVDLLRRVLAAARSGGGDEQLRALLAGRKSALVDCPTRLDVETMVGLAGEYKLQLALLHGTEAIKAAPLLAGSGIAVVVPPCSFTSRQRVLAGPAALERARVPFAFAGMMPDYDADAVRISAALAVRYGLSPEAARKAMTINAARIAGLDKLIGSIEPGKQADLVVFSDDPLRLDARVLAVYINGVRVFARCGE